MGTGTMIVFVAIVLVAAVAAGVLIGTASDLEQTSDGHGAEREASGLGIESLVGTRATTDDARLRSMEIYLTLAPDADDVDLSQTRIRIHNATASSTLHPGAVAVGDRFAATAVRDADGSLRAVPAVMTAGDLVRIDIDLDGTTGTGMAIGAGDDARLVIMPGQGDPVSVAFTTPDSYGLKLAMHLI